MHETIFTRELMECFRGIYIGVHYRTWQHQECHVLRRCSASTIWFPQMTEILVVISQSSEINSRRQIVSDASRIQRDLTQCIPMGDWGPQKHKRFLLLWSEFSTGQTFYDHVIIWLVQIWPPYGLHGSSSAFCDTQVSCMKLLEHLNLIALGITRRELNRSRLLMIVRC